jgi:hypothetical protein
MFYVTGDIDHPGGGAKPGTEGVCVERDRPGRAETAPQSFRYDAVGGGVHQWNNLWFRWCLKTHKYGAAP